MDRYRITITEVAKKDIASAADYIKLVLKNPKAADDLLDETVGRIKSLCTMPQIHQILDDPILGGFEIRAILIKNYAAFYLIDEQKHEVRIIRFLYQKSNWASIVGGKENENGQWF